MGFNSKDFNMLLVDRSAPVPAEKEIIESIPFMQGVLDFSMLLGERVFENRTITYTFRILGIDYDTHKAIERELRQLLMPYGEQKLYDTHDEGYYWLGKCVNVSVDDDEEARMLDIQLEFNCYPFLIGEATYFDDVWDTFDFENDVANWTKYEVKGFKEITLFNAGTNSVKPEVEATSDFKVIHKGETFVFKKGTTSNQLFSILPGLSTVRVEGTGTIAFHSRVEVMA
ncbi:TPA: phage tail domain-containing protein [Streptococcus suis]